MIADHLFTPTRPPRDHQRKSIEKAKGQRAFFILMEMGLGKSKTVLDEMCELFLSDQIDQILVVAGSGSYADWIHKHVPENVPKALNPLTHLWRGGRRQAEREEIKAFMMRRPDASLRVLSMNVEAIGASQIAPHVAKAYMASARTALICDESTKIRNIDAIRTKRMIELAGMTNVVRAMTGLVTPKSPLDMWGQLSFLGLSNQVAHNFFSFRRRYCVLKTEEVFIAGAKANPVTKIVPTRKVERVVGYRNLDELRQKIDKFSFRATKDQCLDLPPKIYETVTVQMSDEQQAAYSSMKKYALSRVSDTQWATAKNAVGVLMKLHQITLGQLIDEQGVTHQLPCNNLEVLSDVIDEMIGKVAIWCPYRHSVASIVNHLRKRYPERVVVEYHGGVPVGLRPHIVKAFQDEDADFFVGTQATGGYGITLTNCRNVIYYGNSFDLEHRLQSEDRFHRDGQHWPVTYVDFVTPRTVSTKILKVLQAKKDIAHELMGDGLQKWLEVDDE